MIHAPTTHHTRPTQARLRQALFNSVQTIISDARVLDLFAGSGALGLEALSWGAQSAVFVESNAQAAKLIAKNISELGTGDRSTVLTSPIEKLHEKLAELGPFDLIVADPPWDKGYENWLVTELDWTAVLRPGGVFCLEWGKQKTRGFQPRSFPEKGLELIRDREYGESVLTTFRKV